MIFNLFHKHSLQPIGIKYIIEYQHKLDNGTIRKCPYKNCTKQYRVYYCKCGKELDREEYKFKNWKNI